MGSMESLLLLGIVAFYLFDAALLLYGDEVVFAQGLRGWHAPTGSDFTLAGRYPALPALLSPGAPVFRSAWDAPAAGGAPGLEALLTAVRPLRWPARLIALMLFGVVPVALLVNADPRWMLGLLAAVYLASSLAVLHVVRLRSVLGLSRREIGAIAFEVIACPPFAINLVRRITLRCGLAIPAVEFAATMLDAKARARLAHVLEARRASVSPPADDAAPDGDGDGATPRSGGEAA